MHLVDEARAGSIGKEGFGNSEWREDYSVRCSNCLYLPLSQTNHRQRIAQSLQSYMSKDHDSLKTLRVSCLTKLSAFKRVALVGDGKGIPALLERVPLTNVVCLIAASIRPQYLDALIRLSQINGRPLLVQPKSRDTSASQRFIEEFRRQGCDSLICHSYSMKLPAAMLEMVNGNAVNIHAALLPKNRGPNPIQWAIIRGENVTGVTAHQMAEEIDAGPIIDQIPVAISLDDTWVTLANKIDVATGVLTHRVIPLVLRGGVTCIPQDDRQATKNTRLTPESPRINFRSMSDLEVYNLIRAQVSPLGGAFLEGLRRERFYFRDYVPLDRIRFLRESYFKNGLRGISAVVDG